MQIHREHKVSPSYTKVFLCDSLCFLSALCVFGFLKLIALVLGAWWQENASDFCHKGAKIHEANT